MLQQDIISRDKLLARYKDKLQNMLFTVKNLRPDTLEKNLLEKKTYQLLELNEKKLTVFPVESNQLLQYIPTKEKQFPTETSDLIAQHELFLR